MKEFFEKEISRLVTLMIQLQDEIFILGEMELREDADRAFSELEEIRGRIDLLKNIDLKRDLDSYFCDGVIYQPITKIGKKFLEFYGSPVYCCGYHGWGWSLSGKE